MLEGLDNQVIQTYNIINYSQYPVREGQAYKPQLLKYSKYQDFQIYIIVNVFNRKGQP